MTTAIQTISPPFFMLVQAGEILDCSQHPSALMWVLLDGKDDFTVAIGIIRDGKREIMGSCADFKASPGGTVYYITSAMDGYLRLIGKTGAVETIRDRVCTLFGKGYLSDPYNFSKIALWEGNTDA